jgi:hypothetical protein
MLLLFQYLVFNILLSLVEEEQVLQEVVVVQEDIVHQFLEKALVAEHLPKHL